MEDQLHMHSAVKRVCAVARVHLPRTEPAPTMILEFRLSSVSTYSCPTCTMSLEATKHSRPLSSPQSIRPSPAPGGHGPLVPSPEHPLPYSPEPCSDLPSSESSPDSTSHSWQNKQLAFCGSLLRPVVRHLTHDLEAYSVHAAGATDCGHLPLC